MSEFDSDSKNDEIDDDDDDDEDDDDYDVLDADCHHKVRKLDHDVEKNADGDPQEKDPNDIETMDLGEGKGDRSTADPAVPSTIEDGGGPPTSPVQTEIRTQRPLGLLAQHGLTTRCPWSKVPLHAPPLPLPKVDDGVEHPPPKEDFRDGGGERGSGGGEEPDFSELERQQKMTRQQQQQQRQVDFGGHLLLMDERFMPSPPLPPSASSSPLTHGSYRATSTPNGHHWTFEEQFKQVNSGPFHVNFLMA